MTASCDARPGYCKPAALVGRSPVPHRPYDAGGRGRTDQRALDQATVLQLPDRATTVVVGNPLIADLSVQPGGLAVVTGKGYGATNFIALDRSGAVLMEKTVEVKGPSDPTVVVYRGPTRQTYSCTPDCSPRITLGDTGKEDFDMATQLYNDYFARTLNQASRPQHPGRGRRRHVLGTLRPRRHAAPYGIGSAVVDLIFSMAKREVTLANGTAAISRL